MSGAGSRFTLSGVAGFEHLAAAEAYKDVKIIHNKQNHYVYWKKVLQKKLLKHTTLVILKIIKKIGAPLKLSFF